MGDIQPRLLNILLSPGLPHMLTENSPRCTHYKVSSCMSPHKSTPPIPINLPFDLSKVMFILTANLTDTIPSALLDRMEIITLSGYTEEEKRVIARDYLIPRQIKENGLRTRSISFSSGALQQVISEYTSEAGLRNLERTIGAICRKVARKIAEGEKEPFAITKNSLPKYLGIPKYGPEMDQEESQVGLATGLAWTQVGGEVLFVEASLIGGKGDLIVTGQLGDVMLPPGKREANVCRGTVFRAEVCAIKGTARLRRARQSYTH